jgi:hypothetical protein
LKTFHKDDQKKGTIGVAIRNAEGSVTLRMTKNFLKRASKLSMPFIDNKDDHCSNFMGEMGPKVARRTSPNALSALSQVICCRNGTKERLSEQS